MHVEIYDKFGKAHCKEDNCKVRADVQITIGTMRLYLCNRHMLELYKELDIVPYVIRYNLVI